MDNAFVTNVGNQLTTTENGAVTFSGSGNANLNFFSGVASMRGKKDQVIALFVSAFLEDQDLAIRNWLWLRDIRGGAGERESFRIIALWLEENHPDIILNNFDKFVELGRFDDLLIFHTSDMIKSACFFIAEHMKEANKLAFKWMPRRPARKRPGPNVKFLREIFGKIFQGKAFTKSEWTKFLSANSVTVEQKMSAGKWEEINFAHVPSVAAMRYRKAFTRRQPERYSAYIESIAKGETTINASTLFPHQLINNLHRNNSHKIDRDQIIGQWNALPDYVQNDKSFLPMIDVSGSMGQRINNSINSAKDAAVGIGLYLSERNKSAFKDVFLTFSGDPQLVQTRGNLYEKLTQTIRSEWGFNTNISRAFQKIVKHAVDFNVSKDDMPEYLIVLSDMQFDPSQSGNKETAFEEASRMFAEKGYDLPKVVFWNLASRGDNPVTHGTNNVIMVSGFSPSIMTSILADVDQFTPFNMMVNTICTERYDWK